MRLSWYAFDRNEEIKGIKLKKMMRHVFPRLGQGGVTEKSTLVMVHQLRTWPRFGFRQTSH
jgi:hypothetical protein